MLSCNASLVLNMKRRTVCSQTVRPCQWRFQVIALLDAFAPHPNLARRPTLNRPAVLRRRLVAAGGGDPAAFSRAAGRQGQ
jgi:hypothetical protein